MGHALRQIDVNTVAAAELYDLLIEADVYY